jgi:uncharacterized membrane protein
MSRLNLVLLLLLIASDLHAAEPSFTPLPDLPGGEIGTSVTALSANGEVAVGASYSDLNPLAQLPSRYPFRWTRDTGMVALGRFPGFANDVSDDGKVVVGRYSFAEPQFAATAFRWSAETGFEHLEHIASTGLSIADSVSADGRFVAGTSSANSLGESRAVRWGPDGRVMELGEGIVTLPVLISSNGSVVAGTTTLIPLVQEAFRWTEDDGMVPLELLPGHLHSTASDMTADGRVIFGGSSGEAPQQFFRWTAAEGTTAIDFPPGAVSDDASVMVGINGGRPAIWTENTGAVELHPFLTSLGLDLTGWTLTEVTAISGDGTTIAGQGIPPDPSMSGAWVAVIPEPSTFGLALVALVLITTRAANNLHRRV